MAEKSNPELAKIGAVFKTIPNKRATVAVTGTSGTTSLAAYAGKWIWLRALTLDITILRGTYTLTANAGMVLDSGSKQHVDYYVDPDDAEVTLSHISSGSATLEILYDD